MENAKTWLAEAGLQRFLDRKASDPCVREDEGVSATHTSSQMHFDHADFLSSMEKLYNLFVQKNSEINLSAIRDETGIWQKHLIDSLLGTKHFDFTGKIMDLGTGGGFPCLPLALTHSSTQFWGLDSVAKKLRAVQSMADDLGLENVKTIHGRAEDLAQMLRYREQFDCVVTRAVAPWPVLLELTLPFIKVGGRFIAYQGPAILEDLETFKGLEKKLGGKIGEIFTEEVFGATRIFVEVEKVSPTPRKYPRETGIVRKQPLK